MKTNKLIITATLMFVGFFLNSCGIGLLVRGVAKKSITVENNVVPKKFIDKNETLIILLWESGSYDKYAKKAFDKFYLGKKEYVTYNDFRTLDKYQDLDKYPYVFSQGPGEKEMYETDTYSYSYTGSRPFHIYDRREGTFSKSKIRSGFFFRIMQAYAMKLNTYRK